MRRILSRSFLSLALAGALLAGLGGASAATASSARLEASVAHTAVARGEPIELHLRVRGDAGAAPDLSLLEEEFQIVGLNQMQRTTIVNGQMEQHRDWIVQLLPLHDGVEQIPPIALDGDPNTASAPLDIAIAAEGASKGFGDRLAEASTTRAGQPELLVETVVDDASPYVQGQAVVQVRILSTQPILSGQLTDLQLEGAAVERVGEDRSYTTTRGGREYGVIERSFAVFPQRSGELQVPPVVFEGQVRDYRRRQTARRRPFGGMSSAFGSSLVDEMEAMLGDDFFGPSGIDSFFGRAGRTVRAHSDSLVLDVQPRPAEADARWWLPAEALKLSEEWDVEPETLEVGEQVTRSLIVQALGVSRDQIPDLELPPVTGLKQYREPAIDETVQTDEGLAAFKLQKTVVIATEPGDYVLPEVELAWWDTATDRARTATLPERRIRVVPAAGTAAPSVAQTPSVAPSSPGTPPETSASSEVDAAPSTSRWELVAAILGVVVGVVVLGRLVARRFASANATQADATRGAGAGGLAVERGSHTLRAAERRLGRACSDGNATAAVQALREVTAARMPEVATLGPATLADRLGDPVLRAEIDRLQRARFAEASDSSWDGTALWEAYQRVRSSANRRGACSEADNPVLPSLYP